MGDGEGSTTDETPGPDEAFQSVLDRQGYGFQYALLKHIRATTGWAPEAIELPVSFRGGTVHIDFVLRKPPQGRIRIVAECKRANPALVDWCFVRTPSYAAPHHSSVALERIRYDVGDPVDRWVAGEQDHFRVGRHPDKTWQSDKIYNLGFVIKRGDAKGDIGGDGRKVIDEAVTQAVRGTNGFLEFLAQHPSFLHPSEPKKQVGFVGTAVFTTANLWVSDAELGDSELATGKVPASSLSPKPWLWLQQNISPDLRHSLRSDERPEGDSLQDYIAHEYLRSVAIVSVPGVEAFLKQGYFEH